MHIIRNCRLILVPNNFGILLYLTLDNGQQSLKLTFKMAYFTCLKPFTHALHIVISSWSPG